jgi:hypothetical protein
MVAAVASLGVAVGHIEGLVAGVRPATAAAARSPTFQRLPAGPATDHLWWPGLRAA